MGAGVNLGQVNFSKGVLSKDLHARGDVASYSAGLKQGVNIVLVKRGGFQNRQGTRFVYKLPGPGRLFPFTFSLDQPYALAFTQGAMRPAAFGGMVLEEHLAITAITKAYPAKVTIPYHAYSAGDQFIARDVEGMVQINERVVTILSIIDEHNFTIDLDTTGYGAFTGSGGGALRTADPTPPPPDPPVPPPVTPPPPPNTGGGGSYCVTVDTPVLMADGGEKLAGSIEVGDQVRTRHEETMVLGAFRVTAVEVVEQEVWLADFGGRKLRGTGNHRVWWDGRWDMISNHGLPDGRADVVRLTVERARTYIANGLLSHNIKPNIP